MPCLGAFGGFGHWLLILAHRLAPAPILAPFSYVQLLPMILLGYLVFGDFPDLWTLIGAGVVLSSGLYLLYRERTMKPGLPPSDIPGRYVVHTSELQSIMRITYDLF